jgi:hypothetical protein
MDEGFAPGIGDKLRSYVYLLVDPRTGRAFFAGRGRNDRCFRHLQAARIAGESGDVAQPTGSGDAASALGESGDVANVAEPGQVAEAGQAAEPMGPGSTAPGDESNLSVGHPGGRSFPFLDRIREIEAGGRPVRIDILRYGLSADEARLVEVVAQEALGLRSERGARIEQAGGIDRGGSDGSARGTSSARRTLPAQRTEATGLNTLLAKPAKIKRSHRVVLLRLGKSCGPGASDAQLDEAIASGWKIGRRWTDPQDRRSPQWALAVVDDVVRAVYRIDGWKRAEPSATAEPVHPAQPSWSATPAPTQPAQPSSSGPLAPTQPAQAPATQSAPTQPAQAAPAPLAQTPASSPAPRWALTGERDAELERKYRGRNVSAYLSSGSQNPVTYVWCGPHWVNSPARIG